MLQRPASRPVGRVLSGTMHANFSRPMTTEVNRMSSSDSVSLSKAKPFEEIPGFRSFPFIGTAWIYFPLIGKYKFQKTHHADLDKYQKFGDIVKEKVGNFHMISCFDPKDVETVMRNTGKYPNNADFDSLKAYRELRKEWYKTSGVMLLNGEEWHSLRSKIQPYIMKPKLVHAFLESMQDISHDLVERIRFLKDGNNEIPDLLPELYKWALESIGYVGLDCRLGCLGNNLDANSEAVKLIKSVETTIECISKLEAFTGNIQWWKFLPSPTWNKFVMASDFFTQTTLKYINRAFEELEKNNNEEKEVTLLQSMLRTPGLNISEVMTTIMDLLLAGIDTTSNTEGFLLHHLARNPEKQEKLYEEIKRVLPSSKDKLTAASVNELHYMKACMKESMRLLPITKGLLRRLDHDVVLSGYRVPAMVNIMCVLQTSSRLEKNFPKANDFIPERWLDKENKPHPYLCLPFGTGTRSCPGRRLTEQEMICATTEILKNFKLECHEELDMMTRFIGVPDKPLKLKFIDRT